MNSEFAFWLAYLLHLLAEFGDSYTTNIALSCGKAQFSEANPISRWLISKLGMPALWAIKIGVLPFAIAFGWDMAGSPEYGTICNGALAAIIGTVAILNFIKLKKAGIKVGWF